MKSGKRGTSSAKDRDSGAPQYFTELGGHRCKRPNLSLLRCHALSPPRGPPGSSLGPASCYVDPAQIRLFSPILSHSMTHLALGSPRISRWFWPIIQPFRARSASNPNAPQVSRFTSGRIQGGLMEDSSRFLLVLPLNLQIFPILPLTLLGTLPSFLFSPKICTKTGRRQPPFGSKILNFSPYPRLG